MQESSLVLVDVTAGSETCAVLGAWELISAPVLFFPHCSSEDTRHTSPKTRFIHLHFQSQGQQRAAGIWNTDSCSSLPALSHPCLINGPFHQPLSTFAVSYHPIVNASSLFQGMSFSVSIMTGLRICLRRNSAPPRNDEFVCDLRKDLPCL